MTPADVPPTPASREAVPQAVNESLASWSVDEMASLLLAFADDHPTKRVGEAMQEAATRLRALLATVSRLSERAREPKTAEQEWARARECIDEGCIWYMHANGLSADVTDFAKRLEESQAEVARLTASRDAATTSDPTYAMVCGPTCGCGKSTPMTKSVAWLCPEKCAHCGKQFLGLAGPLTLRIP